MSVTIIVFGFAKSFLFSLCLFQNTKVHSNLLCGFFAASIVLTGFPDRAKAFQIDLYRSYDIPSRLLGGPIFYFGAADDNVPIYNFSGQKFTYEGLSLETAINGYRLLPTAPPVTDPVQSIALMNINFSYSPDLIDGRFLATLGSQNLFAGFERSFFGHRLMTGISMDTASGSKPTFYIAPEFKLSDLGFRELKFVDRIKIQPGVDFTTAGKYQKSFVKIELPTEELFGKPLSIEVSQRELDIAPDTPRLSVNATLKYQF